MRRAIGVLLVFGVTAVATMEIGSLARRWRDLGPLPSGHPMPAFTLTTLEGDALRPSELMGQVTVMTFWTTWCPACRSELADLDALDDMYRPEDVRFIAVNLEGSQMDAGAASRLVEAFRRERGLELPMAIDDGSAARALRIGPIPHTIVIDEAGQIRRVHQGRVRRSTLEKDIERSARRSTSAAP